MTNIKAEITALRKMSPKQLRARYAELTCESIRSGNREMLLKKLSWLIQSREQGGLSERARKRAAQLARDSDVRTTAPSATNGTTRTTRTPTKRDARLPAPGTTIVRAYKGEELHVTALDDGFEYEGERYRTLSAVAKAITGSHTNGFMFFRLGKYAR